MIKKDEITVKIEKELIECDLNEMETMIEQFKDALEINCKTHTIAHALHLVEQSKKLLETTKKWTDEPTTIRM